MQVHQVQGSRPAEKIPGGKRSSTEKEDYSASAGQEIFLSYEDRAGETILAFLRLRKVARPHRDELQVVQ